MTVSLGSSLASEGICLFVDCGRRILVSETQNEIVVSWITLWGMIKVYWLDLTWFQPTFSIMLSAARLPQVRTEACISLQASWERSKVRRTVRTMFGELKSSVKKRIIVCRTVRSMFGKQTFAQLRTGFRGDVKKKEASFVYNLCWAVHASFGDLGLLGVGTVKRCTFYIKSSSNFKWIGLSTNCFSCSCWCFLDAVLAWSLQLYW